MQHLIMRHIRNYVMKIATNCETAGRALFTNNLKQPSFKQNFSSGGRTKAPRLCGPAFGAPYLVAACRVNY